MKEITAAMTAGEARECVSAIRDHLHRARQLLLDLYEREGWRALGYSSFAECIEVEFKKSRSYLYRELAAGRLESGLDMDVGTLPESHARAVLEVMGDDEDGAAQVVVELGDSPGLTAKDYAREAKIVWVERNVGYYPIYEHMRDGEVSVNDAYRIGRLMESADNEEAWLVLSHTTDPQLADDLLALQVEYPSMWHEVLSSGSIPYDGESVALEDATYTMLRAWVTIDNAEARAQYVENNRAYYDGRNELADIIIDMAYSLCWHIHNGGDSETILAMSSKVRDLIDELREIETKHQQERQHD